MAGSTRRQLGIETTPTSLIYISRAASGLRRSAKLHRVFDKPAETQCTPVMSCVQRAQVPERRERAPLASPAGASSSVKHDPDRTIHVQIVRSGDFDIYTLHVSAVSVASGSCLL